MLSIWDLPHIDNSETSTGPKHSSTLLASIPFKGFKTAALVAGWFMGAIQHAHLGV